MKFKWDEAKSRKNMEKHGVSFEQARQIFDGFTLEIIDERYEYGEVKKIQKSLTLKELASRSDSEIDTSDIAELDENFWKNAKITPPRTKPNVSLRLDEKTIAYFKAKNPKGYTARMAAVLAAYVNAHRVE